MLRCAILLPLSWCMLRAARVAALCRQSCQPTFPCKHSAFASPCRVINCAAQAAPAACEGDGETAARAINIPTQLLAALESHAARHGRCAGRAVRVVRGLQQLLFATACCSCSEVLLCLPCLVGRFAPIQPCATPSRCFTRPALCCFVPHRSSSPPCCCSRPALVHLCAVLFAHCSSSPALLLQPPRPGASLHRPCVRGQQQHVPRRS